MLKKLIGLIFFIFIVTIFVSLYLSNYSIGTSRYTIYDKRIPVSYNGYQIVQISDLHGRKLNGKIMKAIRKAKPNIVVITGDLTDSEDQWASVSVLLNGLKKIAPVYYVTGNHEWADLDTKELLDKIKSTGVIVLQNEYVNLKIGVESIILAGIDDPNGYADKKTPTELAGEIRANVGDKYTVLLSHRPDNFEKYAELGYNLVLSGHIHGGLIRLPYIGGLFGPGMELLPEYSGGIYRHGDRTLIVSRGLAGVLRIPRLFNRLDIPIITLTTE